MEGPHVKLTDASATAAGGPATFAETPETVAATHVTVAEPLAIVEHVSANLAKTPATVEGPSAKVAEAPETVEGGPAKLTWGRKTVEERSVTITWTPSTVVLSPNRSVFTILAEMRALQPPVGRKCLPRKTSGSSAHRLTRSPGSGFRVVKWNFCRLTPPHSEPILPSPLND